MRLNEIQLAEETLQKLDPRLGQIIELQKPITRLPREDYFFSLCKSIVSQQISVSAASAIFSRLEDVTELKPFKVAQLSTGQIKNIGLSKQKANYLIDLAQHFVENPEIYNHLDKSTDEEVINELIAVKGIGLWTAQMFLMFTLQRPDIFASDDIGLQRAMKKLYKWLEIPSKSKLNKTAEVWKPYRTVACWHLWEYLDNPRK